MAAPPPRPRGARPMPTGNGSYMNVTSPTLSAQEGVDSPGATTPYLNPRPRLNLNIGGGLQTPTPPPQPQQSEGSESFSLRPNLSVVYGQGGAATAAKKPALKLGLQIGKPTPALNLSIPSIQTSRTQSGNNSPSEAYESYYGIIPQPNQQPVAPPTNNSLSTPYTEPFSAETIRPPIATIVPAANGTTTVRENEMVDLQKAIEAIQIREATDPENEDAIRWNNDMFESVRRLGEGAGGAVYQVKQKNTGKMMAMKTIPANPETPPPAAEVVLLMEFCEGGSLETVSKKLREQKKRIGEPVVAKLALLSVIVNGDIPELEDEAEGPDGQPGAVWSQGMKDFVNRCLIIDGTRRPSPREILQDDWLVQNGNVDIDMEKWMRHLFNWPKPPRKGVRRPKPSDGSSSGTPGGSMDSSSQPLSATSAYSATTETGYDTPRIITESSSS
ncbi:Protein kinase C signaling pathway involved MAPKK protein [Tulasnella sp. 408]|nr:Protein kinase C signaling pathway involved MAPKK protein [Tulasnella sp. 408]